MMTREEFAAYSKRWRAVCKILEAGAPNSTETERRTMRADEKRLRSIIAHAPWQERIEGNAIVIVER